MDLNLCSTINYISEPNRIFDFHSGQTKDIKINEYIRDTI